MARFLTLLAITVLLIPAAKAQEFTSEQKEQINKMFEAYILANGEKIVESVENFQNQKEAAEQAKSEEQAKKFIDQVSKETSRPRTGNAKGDITLVEFFDYNCGYCGRALEELIKVLDKDKNVNVIFVDMPILGEASLEASKWSLAAHKQGKYFEYHQALFEHRGQKDSATLEKIGKNLGLDVEQLKKDKDSKEVTDTLNGNIEQAHKMNVRGTPGFIINGRIYPGYMPAKRITEIIEEERKG